MGKTKSGGFTVIEVTLFLAISSGLFLLALIGTGTLMTSIRFTDTMRSTHAYVQSQYDEILNGVNPRQAEQICGAATEVDPGKSNCLLLGKLLNFDIGSTNLQTYYIVSTRIPDLSGADSGSSDEELIADVDPIIVKGEDMRERYDIPWGAEVFASKRLNDDRRVNSYALLRSPRSSRLVSYTFTIDRSALDGAGETPLATYLSQPANIQQKTNFCMRSVDSPDKPAAITVADGEGQNAISLQFDIGDVAESCNGS